MSTQYWLVMATDRQILHDGIIDCTMHVVAQVKMEMPECFKLFKTRDVLIRQWPYPMPS